MDNFFPKLLTRVGNCFNVAGPGVCDKTNSNGIRPVVLWIWKLHPNVITSAYTSQSFRDILLVNDSNKSPWILLRTHLMYTCTSNLTKSTLYSDTLPNSYRRTIDFPLILTRDKICSNMCPLVQNRSSIACNKDQFMAVHKSNSCPLEKHLTTFPGHLHTDYKQLVI